jgi:hypothetical protein
MRSPGRKPNPIKLRLVGSHIDEDSFVDLVEAHLLRDMREVMKIAEEYLPKPEPVVQPDPNEIKRLEILAKMDELRGELESLEGETTIDITKLPGGLSSTKTRPNL